MLKNSLCAKGRLLVQARGVEAEKGCALVCLGGGLFSDRMDDVEPDMVRPWLPHLPS